MKMALNYISAQWRQNCLLINSDLPLQTDLYSSSLLTQALTSREGSLASRLIQDRADMLQMELPSLTTRRLALVSFPVGGAGQKQQKPAENTSTTFPLNQTHHSVHDTKTNYNLWLSHCTLCPLPNGNVVSVPVAMSKRKEKMLPLSSPAQRILPGASKERDSTRPVSLLEPPFTFFPVEMFTTCRWCLLFPTCNTELHYFHRAAPRNWLWTAVRRVKTSAGCKIWNISTKNSVIQQKVHNVILCSGRWYQHRAALVDRPVKPVQTRKKHNSPSHNSSCLLLVLTIG